MGMEINDKPLKDHNNLRNLAGCLSDSKSFRGDPVEIQREMRSEWDELISGLNVEECAIVKPDTEIESQ